MSINYKVPSLRAPSSTSGAGNRMTSADGQRWAISRYQKRALPNHKFDVVECWTLKQRDANGKACVVQAQADKATAAAFVNGAAAPVEAATPAPAAAAPKATARNVMKVFSGVEQSPHHGGKQVQVLVAATSRDKAIELLAGAGLVVSQSRMKSHWTDTGNLHNRALALAEPGAVFLSTGANDNENFTLAPTKNPNPAPAPARLTFKAVNKELAKRPGWAGEELVQGDGYLYFMGGNADSWFTSSIPVARLSHASMRTILADFDHFVRDHAKRWGQPMPTPEPTPSPAPATGSAYFMARLKAAMARDLTPAEVGRADVLRATGKTVDEIAADLSTTANQQAAAERADFEAHYATPARPPVPNPADALLALAEAAMVDAVKRSCWGTQPKSGEPVITIAGIKQRELPPGPMLTATADLPGVHLTLYIEMDLDFTRGGAIRVFS